MNIGDLVRVNVLWGQREWIVQNAIGIIIEHDHDSYVWRVLFSHGLVSMAEWELRMI